MSGDTPTGRGARGGIRDAGALAVAGAGASVAGLALTVALARLLTEREYGTYLQLTAVFLVLSMPGSAVLVSVVRRARQWEASGAAARVVPWVSGLRRRAALLVAVLAGVVAAVSGWVTDELAIPSRAGLVMVVAGGGGWLLLSINRGLLQARQRYQSLAWNLFLETGGRVVLAVVLVALGLGVEGTAIAIVASMAVSDLHARRSLARAHQPGGSVRGAELAAAVEGPATPSVVVQEASLASDAGSALATLALLALLQNIDVIVLGRARPDHAGPYGAISVACKALAYGAIVLSGYLLPEAAAQAVRGRHALRQLALAAGFIAVPAATLLALAVAAPEPFLGLVFGDDLTDAAPALAPLALAMTCFALTVLCTHYLLGVGRRRVVALLAGATVAALVLLPGARGGYLATARVELGLHAVLAAAALALVLADARRRPRAATAS